MLLYELCIYNYNFWLLPIDTHFWTDLEYGQMVICGGNARLAV